MNKINGTFIAWGIIALFAIGTGCTVTWVRSGGDSYLDMEGMPHISRQTDSEISNNKLEKIEDKVNLIKEDVQQTNHTVQKVNVRVKDVKQEVEVANDSLIKKIK